MAITQLSPGVKVNEIDLTNVVPSAASSIGAYVGDFTWGPIEEIVTISREKELVDIFGKPTKYKAIDFTALSLFLKYTDHAEVVRMVDDTTARNATADTISGGRLIKNRDHYEGLTGTLSAITNVTLLATADAKVGESVITVDDASIITGGDIITGPNVAPGTTVVAINGNQVTLSQPLEGVIPVIAITEDIVEVASNVTAEAIYPAGSSVLQTTQYFEYQVGAVAYHYDPLGGVPAFPDATLILPAVYDFAVNDTAVGGTSGVSGPITAISAATGSMTVDVVTPGFVVGEQVNGATQGQGIVDSSVVRAVIDVDTSYQYLVLSTEHATLQLGVGEAALFAIGDTVVGDTSTVAGQVTSVDVANDRIVVDSNGSDYTNGETINAATATIGTSLQGVETLVIGDTVTNTATGATGVVQYIDTVNHIVHINATVGTFVAGSLTGGTLGNGVISTVNANGLSNIVAGDTLTGALSGATGKVLSIDTVNNQITLTDVVGVFTMPESFTGGSTVFGTMHATAADYFEVVTLRRIADGSIDLANVLSINMPATERILVDQKFEVAKTTDIGDFSVYVTDTSHIEIGDEMIELGMANGALVTGIVPMDLFTVGAGDLTLHNVAVGDVVSAPLGSGATGTVIYVDAAKDEIAIVPDNAAIPFVAGDAIDVTRNGVTTIGITTIAGTRTPVKYADNVPGIVQMDLAVTDQIPFGTVGTNRRVQDLDLVALPFGAEFIALSSVDGITVGDEVDPYITVPSIQSGTHIVSIDAANKVVKLNQPTAPLTQLAFNTPLYISRRVNLLQDSYVESTSLFVDHTASIAAGDTIINITGTGIQINTKVVSVNHATGEVILDTPLMGQVPIAVVTGDAFDVEVYRGPWYAKSAGAIGNSLRVEMCGNATSFANWAYKGYFTGAPGSSDYAAARGGSNDELHIVVIDEDGKFTGVPGTVLENFAYVSQAADCRLADGTNNYYVDVINDRSAYIYWGAHDPSLVDAGKDAEGVAFTQLTSVMATSLTEGADSANIGIAQWSTGFELFRDVETVIVDFLMQPSIPNNADGKAMQDLLIDIAEFRTDCIALLSPPVALTAYGALNPVDNVIAWFDQINSTSYAVFDSSAIKVYDKYNDQYLMLPASSSIAGLCARTDDTDAPWFSPAGYTRGQIKGVVKLAHIPRKVERDKLYSARINPLATFPGEGTVLYGDKTALAKPSAFDRINVRRLFITLERAISNASKFMLFEFNDAVTRQNFIAMVEPFLRNVQGLRGIQDFHVVCDETNNTDYIIDTNQFVGDIYIKPNRSINFITLNFIAVRTGVSFSEIATGLYE